MIADLKPYPEYKDSGLSWLGPLPRTLGGAETQASEPTLLVEAGHPPLEPIGTTAMRHRDIRGS